MIKTTRWQPDHCNCVFEYQWDSDLPADKRSHTISKVVNKCDAHNGHSDDPAHFDAVLKENQTKNQAIGFIVEHSPDHFIIDSEGNKSPDLKKIRYSFDKDRKLSISVDGIEDTQKENAQEAIDEKFGLGKVSII